VNVKYSVIQRVFILAAYGFIRKKPIKSVSRFRIWFIGVSVPSD
jgi:hypothetical protein